jgi:RecJ-like exonuclease
MSTPPDADREGVELSRDAVVYDVAPDCTRADLAVGELYDAEVNGIVDYGVFVDLSASLSGLVHESELDGDRSYTVGEELIVRLIDVRENGDLGFAAVDTDPADHETAPRRHEYESVAASDLEGVLGETIAFEGEVARIEQTGGPTLFGVRDGSGIVPCAAFEAAGVRAYPDVGIDDPIRVVGVPERRGDGLQIEVDRLARLNGEEADSITKRIEETLAERVEPHDVDPLIDWDALETLRPGIEEVARLLRRAVLDGRPIRIRHHADGDGMCASLPTQIALERFAERVHADPSATRHAVKRLPSKAPFYEMEDVVRDLNYALESRERHGQRMPLLLMLDNGSTAEDVPAYRTLRQYDVPIVAVDHHHPDPEAVAPWLDAHVNPYLEGEDYAVTTGMCCVELARMIEPDLTEDLEHVPAVAGLSDRSDAEAMSEYLALAERAGYEESSLRDVGEALDYAAFQLRYNDGRHLVDDLLDLGGDTDRHRELVELLADRAERDVGRQLDATLPHTEREDLANGAACFRVDLENYAHRFTYPPPGKTTGKIHDRKVAEEGEPVITIGYGPDFAVLRSDGVRLDIPRTVNELTEELPGAGVSGGGHLVVGSIKFVKGKRETVLDRLVEKLGEADLDEQLGSAAVAGFED